MRETCLVSFKKWNIS